MRTFPWFLVVASIYTLALTACCAEPPDAGAPEASHVSVPPDFVPIPAGEFMMGDSLDGMKDAPRHRVNVSAFYMQKNLVSKAQWEDVREWALMHGYTDLKKGVAKASDHPVVEVSWYAALKWCNAKSEREGLTPCYYTDAKLTQVYRSGDKELTKAMVKWKADGYRLPTEAEWEKAARGGLAGQRFPWGNTISHDQANFFNGGKEPYQSGSAGYHPAYKTNKMANDFEGLPFTSPVGSFAANGYGLNDMAGNVWELCWDRLAIYPEVLETDPRGPDLGSNHVCHGGSWANSASGCRVARRLGHGTGFSINSDGFRPIRSSVP